jgi:colicin import membrane protein
MNPAPPSTREPGKRISIALAIAVHVVLAALLIYGIHWQNKAEKVVQVDLVRSVPSPKAAPTPPKPKPEPKPEPKPPPKAEPKPAPKPPKKPDIAVKEKKKPKPRKKAQPKFDPFQQQLAAEEKRLAMERQIAADQQQLAQKQQAMAASARAKALAAYSDRIRAKIRGNIVLPPNLEGNPVAVFEVVQLPSGEVISSRLIKTSGVTAYDDAVERAIRKSSPLPRPDDPSLFDRSLRLTFCPREDGNCD